MEQERKNLPLSTVALVFAVLSIPLAFARHLVSLAFVLAILALMFGLVGRCRSMREPERWTMVSMKRVKWAVWIALLGILCATVMWALWANNLLF